MSSLSELVKTDRSRTVLAYCAPGVGKSTFIGIVGEQSNGKTLVLDVDRTFVPTMKKNEVVHDFSKIDVWQIDNVHTWDSWNETMSKLQKEGANYENICVDNISELERCLLSDSGSQGKNKGVPAMGDYQYMQFKLVNSLRFMKSLGCNIYWTAWETVDPYTLPDGSSYSMSKPKISAKIVDNICGLCDVVARITIGKDGGVRGLILESTQNVYAKNQRDTRKFCKVEEYLKGDK